jgi:hypothetical protein
MYPLDDCRPDDEEMKAEETASERGSTGLKEVVPTEAMPAMESEDGTPVTEIEQGSEDKRQLEDEDEKQDSPSSHGAKTLVDEAPYEPKAELPRLMDLEVYAPPGEQQKIQRREGWTVS